jgi:hypothetical protein
MQSRPESENSKFSAKKTIYPYIFLDILKYSIVLIKFGKNKKLRKSEQ